MNRMCQYLLKSSFHVGFRRLNFNYSIKDTHSYKIRLSDLKSNVFLVVTLCT
jgi:hypothetical protein